MKGLMPYQNLQVQRLRSEKDLQLNEFEKDPPQLRLEKDQGTKAFTNSPIFEVIVDVKVFDELVNMWNKCLRQIQHLDGFKEDFNMSKLELGTDEHLNYYPYYTKTVDVPPKDEFYYLFPPLVVDPFELRTYENHDGQIFSG
ncbi:UNVERIFIED_CONTAM: hypothetical protein Sradi_0474300 [Sesamum radiatum]|uniref:Uncharacterized protein n=1 Tax=Sesamum radiatum TaxID=300843 RepID=A0AAW2W773_SESRA